MAHNLVNNIKTFKHACTLRVQVINTLTNNIIKCTLFVYPIIRIMYSGNLVDYAIILNEVPGVGLPTLRFSVACSTN